MPYHHVFVRAAHAEGAERELNAFLASHCVVTVEREFLVDGANSAWVYAIEYVDGSAMRNAADVKRRKAPVDYRDVLSPDEFAMYAELRKVRQRLAGESNAAPYVVMNNAHLAKIVTDRIVTKEALRKLDGLGETRVERYGDALLSEMKRLLAGEQNPVPDDSANAGA